MSNKMSIEEFGPELHTLLKVAFTKEVQVKMPNKSAAISLRYRLNLLKSRIRETKREDLMHLVKVQVRIEPEPRAEPDAPFFTVHAGPPDQYLTPYIREALAGIPEAQELGDAPDLSGLMSGKQVVEELPEGAGDPPHDVNEPWPLPNTHKPQEVKS